MWPSHEGVGWISLARSCLCRLSFFRNMHAIFLEVVFHSFSFWSILSRSPGIESAPSPLLGWLRARQVITVWCASSSSPELHRLHSGEFARLNLNKYFWKLPWFESIWVVQYVSSPKPRLIHLEISGIQSWVHLPFVEESQLSCHLTMVCFRNTYPGLLAPSSESWPALIVLFYT